MNVGWISLHRQIRKNWVWSDKPFSKGQAFIDMLFRANYENTKILFNGSLIEIERGSFITSEIKLMETWGWSKSKVRSFLTMLENDSMIHKISDNKKTIITLLNYDTYQETQTTKKPVKDFKETTKELQKDTENNINNINKEKQVNNNTKELFEIFWNLYDKKTSREKCLSKWNKLSNKDIQLIFETLPKYIESTPDKLYRKNPETYLNNKSWNDEIIVINNKEISNGSNKANNSGVQIRSTSDIKRTITTEQIEDGIRNLYENGF